jgi:uncharacterized protein DUF4129
MSPNPLSWRRLRCASPCLVAGGLALVAAGPIAAQDASAIRRATAGLGSALDLQETFPVSKEPAPWSLIGPETVRVLLWIAVACGAAALAWYLADILPRGLARRPRWGEDPDVEEGVSDPGAAAQADADDLAQQGRFAEAMHVLLLQSVAEMRKRPDASFADSLTSREILRRAPVSTPARSALGDIVASVERAWFGDHPAGAADYASCRTRFAALSEALRAGGHA